jgi:hypothetical protein
VAATIGLAAVPHNRARIVWTMRDKPDGDARVTMKRTP